MDTQQETLPYVSRFNQWREWTPLIATLSESDWFELESHVQKIDSAETAAVYKYCKCTGYNCLEFVFLANFADPAPHKYPSGVTVVPCQDVLVAAASQPPVMHVPRSEHIYDAWFPLRDASLETIRTALLEIDEIVTFMARAHHANVRWFPKYLETTMRPTPTSKIDARGFSRQSKLLENLDSLPALVRPAVARAAHWLLKAQQQRSPIDRFVFLWIAFEGLLLALYEHASDIALPLDDEQAGWSTEKRQAAVHNNILEILKRHQDPLEGVTAAYFDGVVSIHKRTEAALRATLGVDTNWVSWPYKGKTSPSQLRNEIVHKGTSALEIYQKFPVAKIIDNLEYITDHIIERTLRRVWRGESMPTEGHSMILGLFPGNIIMNAPKGGWKPEGDFRITHQLLAMKGLL